MYSLLPRYVTFEPSRKLLITLPPCCHRYSSETFATNPVTKTTIDMILCRRPWKQPTRKLFNGNIYMPEIYQMPIYIGGGGGGGVFGRPLKTVAASFLFFCVHSGNFISRLLSPLAHLLPLVDRWSKPAYYPYSGANGLVQAPTVPSKFAIMTYLEGACQMRPFPAADSSCRNPDPSDFPGNLTALSVCMLPGAVLPRRRLLRG